MQLVKNQRGFFILNRGFFTVLALFGNFCCYKVWAEKSPYSGLSGMRVRAERPFIFSSPGFPSFFRAESKSNGNTISQKVSSNNTVSSDSSINDDKPENMEELLEKIRQDQVDQRPELAEREARFLKSRDRQRSLLKQALSELDREERRLLILQSRFEKQERELAQLEEKLALTMGVLGELFGVVKQTAGETRALFENSVVSAEYKNRESFIEKISDKKNLPNISDLEGLWFLIQQEMIESGKVTKFQENVIKTGGTTKRQGVIRVGSFNLISQGKYLSYDRETKRLLELPRQPGRRFLSLIKKIEKSQEGVAPFGVDPSRGSLLSLLIQTPDFFERISQGGLIGYIIIFILIYGLFFSALKYFKLKRQERFVQSQMASDEPLANNPLGDIIRTFLKFQNQSQEILELKMEESIVQKTSHLKQGLGTIKLLSSIAPLLGLLGTVTGMILTFQSITLFGTGDPKLMADGISQALVTTALGLVVAIPLVFIHNFLMGKAHRLIGFFEEQTLGLISRKYKEGKNI